MKSLKLKTIEIVKASKLLDEAKYQAMSDEDKVKLWKISRKLKPIADKYTEEKKDAELKLIPSENFHEEMHKGAAYEKFVQSKKEGEPPISKEEYQQIMQKYLDYQVLVNKALKELLDKEEEIEFEPFSEDAWGKLMSSNDWKIAELEPIAFLIE